MHKLLTTVCYHPYAIWIQHRLVWHCWPFTCWKLKGWWCQTTIHQTLTMNFCKICRYQHWVWLPKQTAILKFRQRVPTHKQHYQGAAAQTRALSVQTAPIALPWSSLAGFPRARSLASEASWHLYSSFQISWTYRLTQENGKSRSDKSLYLYIPRTADHEETVWFHSTITTRQACQHN